MNHLKRQLSFLKAAHQCSSSKDNNSESCLLNKLVGNDTNERQVSIVENMMRHGFGSSSATAAEKQFHQRHLLMKLLPEN